MWWQVLYCEFYWKCNSLYSGEEILRIGWRSYRHEFAIRFFWGGGDKVISWRSDLTTWWDVVLWRSWWRCGSTSCQLFTYSQCYYSPPLKFKVKVSSHIYIRQGRYVMPGVCLSLSVWLLATLRKNYWTDLREIFCCRCICGQERVDYILEVIRLRIRIQEFFEGSFNIAISGIFPHFGSYLWIKWADFHENFTTNVTLEKEVVLNFGSHPDPELLLFISVYWRLPVKHPLLCRALNVMLRRSLYPNVCLRGERSKAMSIDKRTEICTNSNSVDRPVF